MDDPAVTVLEPQPVPTAVRDALERQLELVRRQLLGLAVALLGIALLMAGAQDLVGVVFAAVGLFVVITGS